ADHREDNWRNLPPGKKRKANMIPLEVLTWRVKVCTACHVGFKGSDVNHDMIAAGHRRLNFEIGWYFDLLTQHRAKAKHDGNPARLWFLGRAAAAQAAFELLASRADKANGQPWPELSEYNCYACHWKLSNAYKIPSSRAADTSQRPGRLDYGGWY